MQGIMDERGRDPRKLGISIFIHYILRENGREGRGEKSGARQQRGNIKLLSARISTAVKCSLADSHSDSRTKKRVYIYVCKNHKDGG